MTREEAIKIIKKEQEYCDFDSQGYEAFSMAVEALEQEPKYCDRNICIKNEYNGIECDECEVKK